MKVQISVHLYLCTETFCENKTLSLLPSVSLVIVY